MQLKPETPFTPVDVALERLRTLLSPLIGIVRELHELLLPLDDARLIRMQAEVSQPELVVGGGNTFLTTGSGTTRELAEAAALGEAAERYSGLWVPEHRLTLASARDLGRDALGPRAFAFFAASQFAQDQFPYVRFTPSTRTSWVHAMSLLDGHKVYVPAQVVYLPPAPFLAGEQRIAYATTSGMACRASLEEAVLTALLELVERDAVMVTWYGRLTFPVLSDAASDVLPLPSSIRRAGSLRWRVVDLSLISSVPTVMATIRPGNPPGDPVAFVLGAASGLTFEDAIHKALGDAFRLRSSMRLKRARYGRRPPQPDRVIDFDDHALLYTYPENAHHTAFLDAGPLAGFPASEQALRGATPFEVVRDLVTRLANRNIDVYLVDVTAPDVRAAGLHVVRVVSPQLAMIDMGFRYRFLGNPRLRTAPRTLGLRGRSLAVRELNPLPHPFP